MSRLYSSEKK